MGIEFTTLTITRTSEALYARKTEINRERKKWTVPLERDGDGMEKPDSRKSVDARPKSASLSKCHCPIDVSKIIDNMTRCIRTSMSFP